jgi:hypothetical protein
MHKDAVLAAFLQLAIARCDSLLEAQMLVWDWRREYKNRLRSERKHQPQRS